MLIAELTDEFPAADILRVESDGHDRESGKLRGWVGAILEYLDGDRWDIDLPVDVRGILFQWRVWRKLQAIPAGRDTYLSAVGRGTGMVPVYHEKRIGRNLG